jgi:hypothetical protein
MDLIAEFEDSYQVKLPKHKIVCPRYGRHVNPAIDGFSMSELDERYGPDVPEFLDDYFAGAYDVRCEECQGENVIDEVDEDAFSDPQLLEEWHEWQASAAESAAIMAAEMRMGA